MLVLNPGKPAEAWLATIASSDISATRADRIVKVEWNMA
jgi:hypothetical protein